MLYFTRNIRRSYRKCSSPRLNHVRTSNQDEYQQNNVKTCENKNIEPLLQQFQDKIMFSTYLEYEKLQIGYFKNFQKTIKTAKNFEAQKFKDKFLPPLPLYLQYYNGKDQLSGEKTAKETEPTTQFQLPFANSNRTSKLKEVKSEEQPKHSDVEFDKSDIEKWMTNYEYFDDTKFEDESDDSFGNSWCEQYGTADPTASISQVPCGGCGALLHCNDPAIPGYLPSELFNGREKDELKTMECQRCHFLKEYNIALDIIVQPEEYAKLLQSIRYVKSLVLLMVDLLDFPCSIWPGIVDIIGTDRPMFVVANKVDLLPGDSVGYLKRVKECLITEIQKTKLKQANIKHIALISAKTGYGVENLISNMFKLWLYKGDVFLVGCTNVGKSSLFNALLQSDYCKVHAADIVRRATVSRWPGTTLNLLKFPINRPSAWKIRERSLRLLSEGKLIKVEKKIREGQVFGKTIVEAPSLMGYIGRTFSEYKVLDDNTVEKHHKLTVLDEKHELLKNSKWFYDTPGVIHPDQVLSLLSTEELLLTIPKKLIRPQTYYLDKGSTFLIAGLARVDLIDCTEPCRFTIFCSENLPITVIKTEYANVIYNTFLGTELFAVPLGNADRLKNWPALQKKDDFEFTGEGPKLCCGDIVLSSIGWVSITIKKNENCLVAAWTPEGRGIYKRYPSVLPYSVNLKGKRIRDTPAYMLGKVFRGEKL